tara:strand:+ start:295 stop:765 length:471 start_codon:yes stop_codon:yes gene_type:complete
MSGRYNLVKEFIIKPIKNLVKGKKTSKTITSTTPNVGNLKFNQDIKNKLIKTTDAYVTKAGSVDPSLKEALRKAGSKSLQGDKIVRKRNKKSKKIFKTVEGKKDGGRMGLKKGGGADLGMQSVIHGVDNNKNITAADPKAKFIAKAKDKKSKKKFI